MTKETTQKKYKGAVFFDFDGTLVDERLGIYSPTDATKDAISTLRKKGYLVGIATGRAKCYVPDVGVDFDCYVTCNGAVAEIGNDIILNSYIPSKDLIPVLEFLAANGFAYNIETREKCYYGQSNVELLMRVLKLFSITRECFEPLINPSEIPAVKIMAAFEDEAQYEKLCKEFGDKFQMLRHHRGRSCDISAVGISKAGGIEAVIKHFGIDIEETYAFGDDSNDIEMLLTVGHGVAMTPHAPELDGVIKNFTCGVGDEGICKALARYNLI